MKQAVDVIQHCHKLSSQIETLEFNLSESQNSIQIIQTEIDDLQNAKIAIRLEFGSASDPQKIRELQRVLGEIDASINSRRSELQSTVSQTCRIQSELRQMSSAFQSFGCANLRSA